MTNGNGGRMVQILLALLSAMVGAATVGVVYHFTLAGELAALKTEVVLLQDDVAEIPRELKKEDFYWFAPDAVRWRSGVDTALDSLLVEVNRLARALTAHSEKDGIHQTPGEKAAHIREVVGAVLDDWERRMEEER